MCSGALCARCAPAQAHLDPEGSARERESPRAELGLTPTPPSGLQAESRGPCGFAGISTGHLPTPVCSEPGQAEQKYQGRYNITPLKIWDNLQGFSLEISKEA